MKVLKNQYDPDPKENDHSDQKKNLDLEDERPQIVVDSSINADDANKFIEHKFNSVEKNDSNDLDKSNSNDVEKKAATDQRPFSKKRSLLTQEQKKLSKSKKIKNKQLLSFGDENE